MYPIFFSVATSNVDLAEEVWKSFPDNWIYLYSKTGKVGADMWDEISHELSQSKLIVFFWSKHFQEANGCLRELKQAVELVEAGASRCVVLRLDDTPIFWQDGMAVELKSVFEDLKKVLSIRTSEPSINGQRATQIVQALAEPILRDAHPQISRHDALKALSQIVKKDRFTCVPAVWVSGFNGVGRQTVIEEFNRGFVPNGRGIIVEVNEASLPIQLFLQMESQAFGTGIETLRKLSAAENNNSSQAVSAVIERIVQAGNYVIMRHNRIVEENVELPDWLNEVIVQLNSGTRPKLFIVSQVPISTDRRNQCSSSLVAQRLSTVDEPHLIEFCNQLVGYFDQNPTRWKEADVERFVRAAGGNLAFLVSLIRSISSMEDFEKIDEVIALDSDRMVAAMTSYVNWAFRQLQDRIDEQKILLFLNDVTPCDVSDIEKIIGSDKPILRLLGKLLDLGLVERQGDGLYRLTPLLARRLSRNLVLPELKQWLRSSYQTIAATPVEIDDRNGYLKIESRIQASMWSGGEGIPSDIIDFVSASHWFKAGIRMYHARQREPAYRLLKKAYEKRQQFSSTSKSELIRYFGLSAIQNGKIAEARDCINLLDGVYHTKSMAAFLEAALFEHQRNFPRAIEAYERSIDLNRGKDSRIERTYRPLIKCILAGNQPDFSKAERHAKSWLQLRETIFSLMAQARVYLNWKYRGTANGSSPPIDIDQLLAIALHKLEIQPGVGSAAFELKAEEANFSGVFDDALNYMDRAIEADPRFELRVERWRLMANSGQSAFAAMAARELEAAKVNHEFRGNWVPFLPSLLSTYVKALKRIGEYRNDRISSFSEGLSSDEIGAIIAKTNRGELVT